VVPGGKDARGQEPLCLSHQVQILHRLRLLFLLLRLLRLHLLLLLLLLLLLHQLGLAMASTMTMTVMMLMLLLLQHLLLLLHLQVVGGAAQSRHVGHRDAHGHPVAELGRQLERRWPPREALQPNPASLRVPALEHQPVQQPAA
jgi:hypothetical protein